MISKKYYKNFLFNSFFWMLSFLSLTQVLAQTQATSSHSYPQKTIDEYMKSCLTRSSSEGLAEVDANQLCTCSIKKFQSLYSVEDFNKLRQEANNNNQQATEALSNVGYECFDQILYEN